MTNVKIPWLLTKVSLRRRRRRRRTYGTIRLSRCAAGKNSPALMTIPFDYNFIILLVDHAYKGRAKKVDWLPSL